MSRTLYLSLDVMTSIGEVTQGFTYRLSPWTMCEYDLECDGVADLRDDPGRTSAGIRNDELDCAWLSFQLAGKQAPSWFAVDRLKKAGHSGILVRSFAPGASDANNHRVLWRWGPDLRCKVTVYDPSGRLPANQLSWPATFVRSR